MARMPLRALMLTGRVLNAEEGRSLGLAHYVCNTETDPRSSYELGLELAIEVPGQQHALAAGLCGQLHQAIKRGVAVVDADEQRQAAVVR